MRLSKDLDGKALISVADGRIIGNAKDIYLDQELTTVTGLHLGKEGLIKRKSLLIRHEDVVLFGLDVILVKNSDVITDDKALPEAQAWLRREELQGRRANTPGGTRLGVVGDVFLNEDGSIAGLGLSKVFVEGPLAEKGFIPREAVVAASGPDGTITVDLPLLEQLYSGEPAPAEPAAPEPTEEMETAEIAETITIEESAETAEEEE